MQWDIIITALAMLSALALGYFSHGYIIQIQGETARKTAKQILKNSRREADSLLRETQMEARDERLRMRESMEYEAHQRKQEFSLLEEKFGAHRENLDRKTVLIDQKEVALEEKRLQFGEDQKALEVDKVALAKQSDIQREKLSEIAHLDPEEARTLLLKQTESELKSESGALIRKHQEAAKKTCEQEARKIITLAIERYAGAQVSDVSTSIVHLENDESKGRIIGKEGRNIKSLEMETGVNFVIDDTPGVVVLSAFDPLRREIARQALERLLEDGRIHPAAIEETVLKVRSEIDQAILKAGEEAVHELGLLDVHPEIVKTVGRLNYRHSYAQNVLTHSIEMAHLMASMAGELKLDPAIARRVGLLHDIGKALDHEVEGGHATIGADLLKRHGEDELIVNAVGAHHYDIEPASPYATLTIAADAITAARPGARVDSSDQYLKRLENLEEIAESFDGVENCYAIQAGRELRVIVQPDKVNDDEAMEMARSITLKIGETMNFPGQIKVTVIRETRCIEFAN